MAPSTLKLFAPLCLIFIWLSGCADSSNSQPTIDWSTQTFGLIPYPQELRLSGQQFNFEEEVVIEAASNFTFSAKELVGYLQAYELTGQVHAQAEKADIRLVSSDAVQHEEGYHLLITPDEVRVEAKSSTGIFYGIQTLRQLLNSMPPGITALPTLEIKDQPRFAWRGMHLDVSRHFFPVSFIKDYLDYLAMLKINTFHWHLTDDQGWRIEIKQFPKLTSVGGFRDSTLIGHDRDRPRTWDGERYGGFYTQADVKEVVAYAAERSITIVPEIEMPGHAQAAIAAYPEYGVTQDPAVRPWTRWGISPYLFNVDEATFTFIEGVLDEVIALFPGPYIHVGGDEAVKGQWESSAAVAKRMRDLKIKDAHDLQSYFMSRIGKYIQSKGKNMIGWDEIADRELSADATVMFWRGWLGDSAAIHILKQGYPVVMAPTTYVYFDYYQKEDPAEPLAIGGHLPLDKVYAFDPMPEGLTEEASKLILGGQANVWTEYMPTTDHVSYMVFPRILALAEAVWSQPAQRKYDHFLARMQVYEAELKRLDIRYAPHEFNSSP